MQHMELSAAKYTRLRKLIGGVREQMGYEETFGTPMEELAHIAPPSRWQRRILAELEYALTLSQEGAFDAPIGQALDFLLEQAAAQGALTDSDCQKAEALLEPLWAAAQEYELILAAHAHIDMNWMWSWQETVAAALATFRTMLDIMEEYPGFCFSQSQAAVYKLAEDYDPELMEEIKARIREGRWEITATAWVETDKNMPGAESLLRHIKCTRDYLRTHWDVDPASLEIDFSPDTFGHSANLPELDAFGAVKYYYHCRGLDGDQVLYRWRAPSGREVLVYREPHWYNGAVTPSLAAGLADISRRSGGLKTGLMVYGVGDHGGGPTRRDVERALEMMEWPIFPRLRFGTFREFFQAAEAVRENLPVVAQELNCFAPGCYTTQSRLKMGNRRSERALWEADAFASLASACLKRPYPAAQLESAWQKVLFTHFHDILTGSCVQDSREHAMGLFSESMAVANTQHTNALRALSARIDTSGIPAESPADSQSEGAGAGYGLSGGYPRPERGGGLTRIFHVFNSRPEARTEAAEITVWDWPGDLRQLEAVDCAGNPVKLAMMDEQPQNYWDHKYVRLLAEVSVPGFGYTTLILREKPCQLYRHYFNRSVRTTHPTEDFLLENEHLRARFDYRNGALLSLVDKASGTELVAPGQDAGLRLIQTEPATSNAWQIGRYTRIDPLEDTIRLSPLEYGELRQGFQAEQRAAGSLIRSRVTLDKGSKALCYELEIDWNEVGGRESVPVLAYRFPHAFRAEEYLYDVPAGTQRRKPQRLDVPALQYGAAPVPDGRALMLASDCKYGFRGCDDVLSLTLINSAVSPDPYPERGIHHIRIYVGVEEASPAALEGLASRLNAPLHHVSAGRHEGSWPLEGSLLRFEGGTAVLSAVTTAGDGGLLLRCFETCGRDTEVVVSVQSSIRSAERVDLMEKVLEQLQPEGPTVRLKVSANSVAALKLVF